VIGAAYGFLALPVAYFAMLIGLAPGLPATLVPLLGAVCLGVGAFLGLRGGEKRLLLFLLSPALSGLLVAFAAVREGGLPVSFEQSLLLGFLGVQILLVVFLVYRIREARAAAAALAVFCLTYAGFALFLALSFGDD